MIWLILGAIALAGIFFSAGYLLRKLTGKWYIEQKIQWAKEHLAESTKEALLDADREQLQRVREAAEEWSKKQEQKLEKIAFMESVGLERVPGMLPTMADDFWIRRVDGKIKEMYDLSGTRISLCNLAMSAMVTTVGVNPDIVFGNQVITAHELLMDDLEVRRANERTA